MTIWTPSVLARPGTRAQALCDFLAEAIRDGRLQPGQRLPSHRALARDLGVSLGTITRGYSEALERGLVTGEPGRGTFVRHLPSRTLRDLEPADRSPVAVDLFQNFPLSLGDLEREHWRRALREATRDSDIVALLRTNWSDTRRRLAAAGSRWLRLIGVDIEPERLVPTASFQSSLTAALAVLARPGEKVAASELTFPVLRDAADVLGLRLVACAMDSDGVQPGSLDAAARDGARGLVTFPTLHPATAAVQPEARRRSIARTARRHDLWIVEVEAHSHLLGDAPAPLYTVAPERTVLVLDPRYALSMGCAVSVACPPEGHESSFARTAIGAGGPPSPLAAHVTSTWIENGVAQKLVASRRRELEARNRLLARTLATADLRHHPLGHHAWVSVPRGVRREDLVADAEARGVAVTDGAWFALPGATPPAGVRVCIGNPEQREDVAIGLRALEVALGSR